MRIDVVTIFPAFFDVLEVSLLRTVAWSNGTYSATRASALVRAPEPQGLDDEPADT